MHTSNQFKPWPLTWSVEHVRRFWNWYGTNPSQAHNYFSLQVGDAVLQEAARRGALRGTVVDLGCGPGHMVERLLARGLDTLAVDLSPESVEALNRRHAGQPHFLGGRVCTPERVSVEDGTADSVLVIETVEHLEDAPLRGILGEAGRIARRGGYVIVTTPNEENLDDLRTLCPECGCVFHVVQHVRSWSAAALAEAMGRAGFEPVFCRPVLFSPYPPWLRPLHRLAFAFKGVKLPYLLYIGRKP